MDPLQGLGGTNIAPFFCSCVITWPALQKIEPSAIPNQELCNMKADPKMTNSPDEQGIGSSAIGASPTTEHVAEAAHEAIDRVADKGAKAEQRIREKAAAGEQQLREKTAEARATTERAVDQFRQYTQENPIAAAAIAFAAGLVVSRILSR
jgi:ElaB/YqjD/DUF883 family membrane-anchored ribosome-binding protein